MPANITAVKIYSTAISTAATLQLLYALPNADDFECDQDPNALREELASEARTHLSLGKDAPISRPIERFGRIIAEPVVGGLHHRYVRT